MSGQARWVCAQLGSREHYAIPRVLHGAGRLEVLLTDFWATPRWLWTGLPGRRVAAVRERWHHELAGAKVHGLGWSRLAFDASNRGVGWEAVMRRNRWFQERHLEWLEANERLFATAKPGVFFAYSYAARDLLGFFKRLGWRTVLGQIDPGPREQEIVAEEAQRYPRWRGVWRPAPDAYWANWREELGMADLVAVNSQWSLDCLRGEGLPEAKLRILPLAYEFSRASKPGGMKLPEPFTEDRPLRVLFLGQVNLRKGAHHLLEAARALAGLPIRFDFVGPTEIALPDDLPANVCFHGAVSRNATAEFYSSADIFALPTLSDGFALTQLEAQARGLPVIATTRCGTVVEDGINGWLLPDASSGSIARLLRRLVASPDEVSGCQSRARVADSFTLGALRASLDSIERTLV